MKTKTYLRYWRHDNGSTLDIVDGDIKQDELDLRNTQVVYELRYFELKEVKTQK